MLDVIAYLVPLVLVSLIGAYIYVEGQKRKAIVEKQNAVIMRVSTIKNNFKLALKQLVEQNILTIKQHNSVYRIANNFFIFQPVTTQSIEFCEYSLNTMLSALPKEGKESLHFDRVQEQLSLLVNQLPVAANGYNANFYRETLPQLIEQFVDAKENIYLIDDDDLDEQEPLDTLSAESIDGDKDLANCPS